jgi:single-strand DNA-binding protein
MEAESAWENRWAEMRYGWAEENRESDSGEDYILLSIGTKTSSRDDRGQWQSQTEWRRVVVWGEQFAEYAAGLNKGAHVLVEGALRSREYEKDGVKHRIYECRADSILRLERPGRDVGSSADGEPASQDVEVPC